VTLAVFAARAQIEPTRFFAHERGECFAQRRGVAAGERMRVRRERDGGLAWPSRRETPTMSAPGTVLAMNIAYRLELSQPAGLMFAMIPGRKMNENNKLKYSWK
jgi:hypothetical protein